VTVIFECSRPVMWKPGYRRGPAMYRAWWLFFAVGWLRIPFDEFTTTAYDWRE
jgi:hypothetical protein